jgi:hypothetical protein
MALAVHLGVPWHSANHPIELRVELRNADRQAVNDPNGQAVRVEGRVEVGRPPGLRPGTLLDSSFVIPVQGLQLAVGVYQWDLTVRDTSTDTVVTKVLPFEVLPPASGFGPPGPAPRL